jgi:hypothetical protein
MAAGMEEKLTMLRAAEMLPEVKGSTVVQCGRDQCSAGVQFCAVKESSKVQVQRKLETIKARRAERAAWLRACAPEELQEKVGPLVPPHPQRRWC